MSLTSVADSLTVKRGDSGRYAVAYTSQNLIQVITSSENSVGDSRAQYRIDKTKVRPVRAINFKLAKGKAEVLRTLSFAYFTSEAIHE